MIDLSADPSNPSSKPSSAMQIKQLNAIKDYNSALPKNRKNKDSLPELAVSNVAATFTVKTDFKKKTKEMITNYKTIGIMEGLSDDSNGVDKYSISNC